MAVTIASLDWGNRTPDKFIDASVKSTGILQMFTLIDGVKSKSQIPVFDAVLNFGSDLCVFDPQSVATIDEKEMSVANYKWAFQNCKTALQNSYRSVLLRKGANNAETMDSQFKDWLFGYFAKLAGQKVLELAATEIRAEIVADGDVIKPTQSTDDFTDPTKVLGAFRAAYSAMPKDQLDSLFNVTDREYRPSFICNSSVIRAYQLAVADLYTTSNGNETGAVPKYMGMELINFATLTNQEILVAKPANLAMIVDDYADVNAIQTEYEAKVSSDYIWGQFTIGFSYMISENIVYYLGTAA